MRKSLFITVLLLAICVWGVSTAHGVVNDKRDAVTLDETVLFGDKSVAEDLIVDLGIHCDNHLFWDTEYVIGEIPQIKTDFHFSQGGKYNHRFEKTYSGVMIDIHSNFGISSNNGIDLDDFRHIEHFGGMEKILKDVANRTKGDTTNTENVFFADYYDFYPFLVTLDIPVYWEEVIEGIVSVQQVRPDPDLAISHEIADYFRIPVIDNHKLEISITKNDVGAIIDINVRTLDDNGPSIWTNSVVTETACYFTFSNRTWKDEIIDTSYIPGGYGIYCLPFTRDPETDQNFVSVDTLSMVYPIDEETEIVSLEKNDDESNLLLITRENGAYWLTVIDTMTLSELQKIHIVECLEEDYVWNTFYYDNFLVVFSAGNRFSVIEVNEMGVYERMFTANGLEANDLGMPPSHETVMCWDGEKLAMASFQDNDHRRDNCGFSLSVYDKTGTLYIGRYDSSLDVNADIENQHRCRPVDDEPISVKWGL